MNKVTIFKKEGDKVKSRTIENAEVEYFDQYVKVIDSKGTVQIIKNFNNIIVE